MIGHKTSALAAFVCSLIQATAMAAPSTKSLHTVAERSGFQRTGRYDEVDRAVRGLPASLAEAGALHRVRPHAGGPADAGAGRLHAAAR